MSQRNIFSEFVLYLLPQNPQSEKAREIARLYTPTVQIYDIDINRRPDWLDGVPMLRNEQTGDRWKGQIALEQLKYMGMSSKITWNTLPLPPPPPKLVDLHIAQPYQPYQQQPPPQFYQQPVQQPINPIPQPTYQQPVQTTIEQFTMPTQYAQPVHPMAQPVAQPVQPIVQPMAQSVQPSYPTIQQQSSQPIEQKIKANQVQDLPPRDTELNGQVRLPEHISGFSNAQDTSSGQPPQPTHQPPPQQTQQPQQPIHRPPVTRQQHQQQHQQQPNTLMNSQVPPQQRKSKRVQPAAKSPNGEHVALSPEEQNKFETIREPDDHVVTLRSSTIHIPDIIDEEEEPSPSSQ